MASVFVAVALFLLVLGNIGAVDGARGGGGSRETGGDRLPLKAEKSAPTSRGIPGKK